MRRIFSNKRKNRRKIKVIVNKSIARVFNT